MRLIRSLPPFVFGFSCLYVVLIQLRGFMAAREVPVEYFRFFGNEHQQLALFTTNVALHLVPEALLLIGSAALSAYLFKGSRRFNAAMFALGAVVSYAFCLMFYQAVAQTQSNGKPSLNWQELVAQFHAPWWTVPALLSPIIGVAAGVWLVTRINNAAARAEA
jgi:hypothetical protein